MKLPGQKYAGLNSNFYIVFLNSYTKIHIENSFKPTFGVSFDETLDQHGKDCI